MELQLAVQSARSNGRATPPHRTGDSAAAKPMPNYLRPSTGSCHHACKYGGAHTFEDRDAPTRAAPAKPRKQQPASDQPKRSSLIRVRGLVPRKLFGDRGGKGSNNEKVDDEGKKKKGDEAVEWKDIVAYDTLPELDDDKQSAQAMVAGSGSDVIKSKDATRGKKQSHDQAEIITEQVTDGVKNKNGSLMDRKKPGNKQSARSSKMMASSKVSTDEPTRRNTDTAKTVRPPRVKPKPAALAVRNKAAGVDRELVDGYQPLSPSVLQNRATLLRDLQDEMVHDESGTGNTNEEPKPANSLDHEEFEFVFAAAAETSSRPVVPAHRRVKSTSLSSRSVRFPFVTRQSSTKNSATFKLRSSRSSKGPAVLPPDDDQEEKTKPATTRLARSRTRRASLGGGEEIAAGRGIQLRIRSLRRRGVGGGSSGGGFVVPAVALRHQKTLEKKRSQRLYNGVIEETASRLVKTRKSRVKALVGAFESVISRIAK